MNSFKYSHSHYADNVGVYKSSTVSHDYKIGITNNADASTDLSIFTRLYPLLNILITRDLSNPVFRNLVIKNKDKIILHVIVSGYGSTPMEPKTPHPAAMFKHIQELLLNGFPIDQLVLRVDPIIPNEWGLRIFKEVLDTFASLHIKRCRFKLFVQNMNVIQRQAWLQMNLMGFTNPYYNELENKTYYYASSKHRSQIQQIVNNYSSVYEFESCDANDKFDTVTALGCISHRDFKLFDIWNASLDKHIRKDSKCICPINKTELIKSTNTQCQLKCVHCRFKTSNI